MITQFSKIILLILIISGCTSKQKETINQQEIINPFENSQCESLDIKSDIVASNINGLDSVIIIRINNKELFRIALDGDLELLSDTIIKIGNKKIGLFTIADYFQDNQIFYILYNPGDSLSYQSDRLYLPYIDMQICEYNQLDLIAISQDSLFLSSRKQPKTTFSLSIDTLQCNKSGIINYYEFE